MSVLSHPPTLVPACESTAQGIELSAQQVGHALLASRSILVTAESCTGGGVGQAITAVAGSSGWYDRGFIVYSNRAKEEMLGVSTTTLAAFGAVSEQVALEMAQGALARSSAEIAVAVTGIAGPHGGTPETPVGMVCFAWACFDGFAQVAIHHFQGNRAAVRQQSVAIALRGVLTVLQRGMP